MRWLKRISIVFAILLVLIGGLGIFFTNFYEDEVKNFIITKINEEVAIPINVEKVTFSVFKKFPYASLEFNNVVLKPTNSKQDLASIRSVFLQFNIIDVINKNFVIKKIAIENGSLTLLVDKLGKDNFHILKSSENKNKNDNVFKLKHVQFKNIDFYYLNEYKNIDVSFSLKKLNLSGNFSSDSFSLTTEASGFLQQFNSSEQFILKNKKIVFKTELDVNQKTKVYKITTGSISIEALLFNISGELTAKDDFLKINLLSKGNDLPFNDLFSLLPSKQKVSLNDYAADGKISYNTTIIGELSSTKTPIIIADFEVKNAAITETKSGYKLSNITLKGNYTNGEKTSANSSKLSLIDVHADFGAGHISGNYVLTNFEKPYIEIQSEANVDIAMAKSFFKLDSLEIASGNVLLQLNYNGYVQKIQQIKASELKNLNAQGTAQLKDINLKIKNSSSQLSEANGFFKFNNNEIKIDSLSTVVSNSPIFIKGKFTNLLAYLFVEGEWLDVNASLVSSKFMLEDFLISKSSSKKDSIYEINLPKNVSFNLTTKIDSFSFRRFKATHFKGTISLEDNLLSATDLSFNTMGGLVKGSVALDNENPSEILITSSAFLTDINVTELFYQFENFGQTAIDANNLKGTTNTTVSFASVWDRQLKIKKDKIYVAALVFISNGQLINYQPVLALSKFIAVEELKHIKFSELTTQIEVINETISLSKTEIHSSALDLTIAGKHTFKNEIDYRFKVMLNDILWKKAKTKNKNEEFGYVEDDGLGKTALFLKMIGTTQNYKVSYDTEGLKTNWKESVKEEKKTLKTILNNEFGWFKKDSLETTKTPKKDGFKIEWEEEQENTKKEDEKSKKTELEKKEKKGLRKFLDKIAQPQEEEFENSSEF